MLGFIILAVTALVEQAGRRWSCDAWAGLPHSAAVAAATAADAAGSVVLPLKKPIPGCRSQSGDKRVAVGGRVLGVSADCSKPWLTGSV